MPHYNAQTGQYTWGEGGGGWAEPTPIPSPTPNPQGNPDPNVEINNPALSGTPYPSPAPVYYNPGGGQPMQLINALGYDPSVPYGNFGSGVPTERGFGMGGGLVGGALGNLLFPGLGGLLGGKLGSWGGGAFGKWLNSLRSVPGQGGSATTGPLEDVTGNPPTGGGGGGWNPFGGLPPGFTESNRFGGGAPIFTGQGDFGPPDYPGGVFGETLNLNPLPYGGQVMSSSVPAPGGFGGAFGGGGGTLGGSFGGMFGSQLLRHALGQGTIPLNAFGQAAGTWTPQLIQHYQQVGLPNPSALYGFGSAGSKPGAGLPMRQNA